jgi:hypothetical protein
MHVSSHALDLLEQQRQHLLQAMSAIFTAAIKNL